MCIYINSKQLVRNAKGKSCLCFSSAESVSNIEKLNSIVRLMCGDCT